jgi:dTDP-glucose 4,6-dehydratase
LGLDLQLVLLTRRPVEVAARFAVDSAVEVVGGDVRRLPELGSVDFVIHAAASSSVAPGTAAPSPQEESDILIEGTSAAIAAAGGSRLLFLSSGAVYGPRSDAVAEDDVEWSDLDRATVYGRSKWNAEELCRVLAPPMDAVIARLFSFVGPGLPLDRHFAAGNFVGDALSGRSILVRGDGTAVRSYLYAADLVEWLLALLVRGAAGRAYNVGSPEPVTIRALAETVSALAQPRVDVIVSGMRAEISTPEVYLPVTERAKTELGLSVRTPLTAALERTLRWHRSTR